MVEFKTIVFPSDPDEIVRRFASGDEDPYLAERFYPRLARNLAGRKLNGMGVVIAFTLEICDYVLAENVPDSMGSALDSTIPLFIDWIVDDKEIAQTAKDFFERTHKVV